MLQRVRKTALILVVSMTSAYADAPPKTVTLTQDELRALISAEAAKAIAQYVNGSAKGVYDKINKAFAPEVKSPEKSK